MGVRKDDRVQQETIVSICRFRWISDDRCMQRRWGRRRVVNAYPALDTYPNAGSDTDAHDRTAGPVQ
ncbi:hypothetical protein GCM10023219_16290 [Stakelama sediminis]